MQRDPNLVPLSHQHQHALALCVLLERGVRPDGSDARSWNQEVARLYRQEIRFHFEAEEKTLFPAARGYADLQPLVDDLLTEHGLLRAWMGRAEEALLTATELLELARMLASHVRREERDLFEGCQRAMPPAELERIGNELNTYFRTNGMGAEIVPPQRP